MIKAIIWDWNGTLLNDVDNGIQAVNAVLASRHLDPISKEKYRETIKIPIQQFYEDIGVKVRAAEDFAEINRIWIQSYQQNFPAVKLSAHAELVLQTAQERHIANYLISSTVSTELKSQVREKGIWPYFREIIGNDDWEGRSKLAKTQALIEHNHLKSAELLFIGDMFSDFELATAVNAPYVMYSEGLQAIGENTNCPQIHDLAELLDYL